MNNTLHFLFVGVVGGLIGFAVGFPWGVGMATIIIHIVRALQ